MRFLSVLLLLFASSFANAGIAFHTGSINELTIKDKQIQGADVSFVELSGFAEAGSCRVSGGKVRAIVRDDEAGDRIYSLLLSAAMSKTDVEMSVDDNYKNSEGFCFVRNVRFKF